MITDQANVRGTAGRDGKVVGKVTRGNWFEVFASKKDWLLIQALDFTGWVHKSSLMGFGEPKQDVSNGKALTLRPTPQPLPKGSYVPPDSDGGIQAEYVGYGPPIINIKNDTNRVFTVVVGGAKYTLAPQATETITLTAGAYDFKGSAPSVVPVSGRKLFENGYHYTWTFYIVRR